MASNTKIGIKITNTSINKSRAQQQLQQQLNDVGRRLYLTIGNDGNTRLVNSFRNLNTTINQSRTQITQLNNSLNRINTQHQQLDRVSGNMQRNYLSNMGMIIKKIADWAIGTGIIYQSLNQLKQGVQYIIDLNQAVTDLSKVANYTNEELEQITKSTIDMGNAFAKSSIDIMKANAEFARFTKNRDEMESLTEAAAVFSNVTTLTAEQSAKTLSTGMTAFGVKAKDAMTIVDKFNEVQNKNRVSAEDLAAAVENVGGVAQIAGLKIDDLNGMITAMTKATGKSGAELSNSLKTIIARTYSIGSEGEDSMAKVEATLQGIGIAVRNSTGEFRPFANILQDLDKQWTSLSNVTQLNIAQVMSGKLHYSKFMALMNEFNTVQKVATESASSYGSALEENEKQVNSLNGRIQLLKNAFQAFWQESLSSDMIKHIIDFGTSIVKLADSLGGLPTILISVATGFASFKIIQYLLITLPAFNQQVAQLAVQLVIASGNTITFEQALAGLRAGSMATRLSMIGLNVAMGAVSIAISAAVMAYGYFSNKQRESEEASKRLIASLEEQKEKAQSLSSEYTKVINSTADDTTKKSQLIALQNTLIETYGKEAKSLDLVNGKYETQIKKLSDLNAKKANEIITAQAGAYKEAQKAVSKVSTKEIATFGSQGLQGKAGSLLGLDVKELVSIAEKVQNKTNGLFVKYSDSFSEATVSVQGDLKTQVKAYSDLIAQMNLIKNPNKDQIAVMKNLSGLYSKAKNELADYNKTIDNYNKALSDKTVTEKYGKDILKAEGIFEKLKNTQDEAAKTKLADSLEAVQKKVLKVASSGKETKDVINKLNDVFEMYNISTNNAVENTEVLADTEKDLDSTINETLKSIQENTKALQEYSDEGKFSSSTLQDLILKYPQLTAYLNDEAELRKQLTKIQENETQVAVDSFIKKLEASEEFFDVYTKNNETFWNALASTYGLDVNNFKTAAEAKSEINSELIKTMGSNWKEYYDVQSNTFTGLATATEIYGSKAEIDKIHAMQNAYEKISQDLQKIATVDFKPIISGAAYEGATKEEKKEATAEQKVIDAIINDRYYELNNRLAKINSQLEKNATLQDLLAKNENASIEDKIKLIKEEINLSRQKQTTDHIIAEEKRKERAELTSFLKSQGATFSGTAETLSITNLQNLINQKTQELNALGETISKTTTTSLGGLPTSGTITSKFGKRTAPTSGASTNHKGIDIGASLGTSVQTMFGGNVLTTGYDANGFGNYVKVKSAEGIVETFGHLSQILVKSGQEIIQGTEIGKVGSTGNSRGAHLHYQTEQNGTPVDPQALLTKTSKTNKDIIKSNDTVYDTAKKNYDNLISKIDRFTSIQATEIPELQKDYLTLDGVIVEATKEIETLLVEKLQKSFDEFDKSLTNTKQNTELLNHQMSRLDETDFDTKINLYNQLMDEASTETEMTALEIKRLENYMSQTSGETDLLATRIAELKNQQQSNLTTIYEYTKAIKSQKEAIVEANKAERERQATQAETIMSSYFKQLTKNLDEQKKKYEEAGQAQADYFNYEIEQLDLAIEKLQAQNNELEEQKQTAKDLLEIEQQKDKIKNLQNEKTKKIFREGKWIYEVDFAAIKEETQKLAELEETRVTTEKNKETEIKIKELNAQKQHYEKMAKDTQKFYNDEITKLSTFADEQYQLFENTDNNIYISAEKTAEALSKLDSSNYTDRLIKLNEFIAEYNRLYGTLRMSELSAIAVVSPSQNVISPIPNPPTTSLSATDKSVGEKMVKVNQGVAGKETYESVSSVEARQKVRYNNAITSGNKVLASQIKAETVKAIGHKTSSFANEGFTGTWSSGMGKLAMVHPEEFILKKNSVSNILYGGLDAIINKIPGFNTQGITEKTQNVSQDIYIDTINLPNVEDSNDFLTEIRKISRKK